MRLYLFALALFFNLIVNGQDYAFQTWSCSEDINHVDRAKIYYTDVNSDVSQSLDLYAVNSECYKCSMSLIAYGTDGIGFNCAALWTAHEWTLYFLENSTNVVISSSKYTFGDGGEYQISPNVDLTIHVHESVSPVDSMAPFYVLLLIIFLVIVVSFLGPFVIRCLDNSVNSYSALPLNVDEGNDKRPYEPFETGRMSDGSLSLPRTLSSRAPSVSSTQPEPVKKKRLQSLDTFRGFSLILMIFVNYSAGGYWFLDHSPWNGITPADLLFPWFMWMMGTSMALSFNSILPKHTSEGTAAIGWTIWAKVLRRTCILYVLNIFLNNGYVLGKWRFPGVLAYFAIAYFVTAATIIAMHTYSQNQIYAIEEQESLHNAKSRFEEEKNCICCNITPKHGIGWAYRAEFIIQGIILIVFLSVSLGAKVPGCPRGYNGAGGLSEESEHFDCTGGVHRYIDNQIFGVHHFYDDPTCGELYQCVSYDPEGLLGSLSACTLTYLGLLAGRVLIHFKSDQLRLTRWIIGGLALLLISAILCGFSQNDGIIPINKNLWSTSFVLLAAGSGLLGLSTCYILVDKMQVWTGAPFTYLGMNSIFIYCGSDVFQEFFPFSYEVKNQTHANLLIMTCIGVTAWIIVAWYMHRINWFVKI